MVKSSHIPTITDKNSKKTTYNQTPARCIFEQNTKKQTNQKNLTKQGEKYKLPQEKEK